MRSGQAESSIAYEHRLWVERVVPLYLRDLNSTFSSILCHLIASLSPDEWILVLSKLLNLFERCLFVKNLSSLEHRLNSEEKRGCSSFNVLVDVDFL